MDVGKAMSLADQVLQDPLRSRVKGLFSGVSLPTLLPSVAGRHFCAGNVVDVGEHWLELDALQFVPGGGFVDSSSDPSKITLHLLDATGRSIHLAKDVQVMCSGVLKHQKGSHEFWLEQATLAFRPEYVPEMAWTALHLFAGSFSGWSQALRWLSSTQPLLLKGQEIAIDSDETVMKLWSLKHNIPAIFPPIAHNVPWNPAECVGVCSPVQEPSILNLLRAQFNLIQTMSPPCQSWSRGGRQVGLADPNGFSFLEALGVAACSQPIVLVAECDQACTLASCTGICQFGGI